MYSRILSSSQKSTGTRVLTAHKDLICALPQIITVTIWDKNFFWMTADCFEVEKNKHTAVPLVVYIRGSHGCHWHRIIRQILFLEEAKALRDTHMGTADDSLDVTLYQLARRRIGGNSYFTITNKLCVPVGETITGTLPSTGKQGWEGVAACRTKVCQ